MPLFKKKMKKEKEQLKTAQNLIPLKAVDSGLLLTPDNRLVQGLKVSALNLDLMSKLERRKLFEAYEMFLKSLSFEFQQLIVSQPVDLKQYIYSNEKMLENTMNTHRRNLLKGYVGYTKAIETTRSVMQRQRYFIFDEKIKKSTPEAYEEAMKDLREKKDHVVEGLKELDLMVDSMSNLEIIKNFHIFFNYEEALNAPIENEIIPKVIVGGK